jgi:hypothetical protein
MERSQSTSPCHLHVAGRGGPLEHLIPIFAVSRRKVNQEIELSCCPTGNVRYGKANHVHQHATRFVCIESCHDFGSLRQPSDGQLDQLRLLGIGFTRQAGVTGSVFGIRE